MNENRPKKLITIREVLLLIATAISLFFLDLPIADFFHDAPRIVHDFFHSFTDFSTVMHVPLVLLAMAYCKWIKKDEVWFRRWVFVFAALAVVCLLTHSSKFVIGRYRPSLYFRDGLTGFRPFGMIWTGKANSFPSGHTSNIIALALALGVLFPGIRYFFYTLGCAIAFSRVALTAHYFSDVLLGIFVAILGVRIAYNFLIKRGWIIDPPRKTGKQPAGT